MPTIPRSNSLNPHMTQDQVAHGIKHQKRFINNKYICPGRRHSERSNVISPSKTPTNTRPQKLISHDVTNIRVAILIQILSMQPTQLLPSNG